MTRYLSGLCVTGLGLCGGGWLMAVAELAGGETGTAGRVNLLTGTALVLASALGMWCWAAAWRRRLRADGVLGDAATGSGVPAGGLREARRNRRALRRDTRRAARGARLARRAARREAKMARRQAGDLAAAGREGAVHLVPAPADLVPAPRTGAADADESQALLSELRALLQPLLTAAEKQPWPRLASAGSVPAGEVSAGSTPVTGPAAEARPAGGPPCEGEEAW